MGWINETLQHRFEAKEPELAQAARNKVREITGLNGNRDVSVRYAEWTTDDPSVPNPYPHMEIRSVGVFPDGQGPATVSYYGIETHRRGGNLSAYNYPDEVLYTVETFKVSPEHLLFNKGIIRHYLIQSGLDNTLGYAMRFLGEQQRQYRKQTRQRRQAR